MFVRKNLFVNWVTLALEIFIHFSYLYRFDKNLTIFEGSKFKFNEDL